MSEDVGEKVRLARLMASHKNPYLSLALFAMTPIESEQVPTMGVDPWWRMYYNPKFVDPLSVEEVSSVVLHEVWHLLRDHQGRGKVIDAHPEVWNIAGDCEINDDLIKMDWIKIPGDFCLPEKFGLSDDDVAEEYYDRLQKMSRPCTGDCGCQIISKDGNDPNCGLCPGDGTPCVSHDCGSGAHGESRPWEREGGQGVSRGEGESIRNKTARDIQEAASRSRGNMPAGWEIWAKNHLTPVIDWRKELRAQVLSAMADTNGLTDYTYRRISRRQSSMPQVVIPSLRAPSPHMAVVVDTSGSMGTERLERCLAEIDGILRSAGVGNGVPVISVDAAVHTARKVFSPAQVRLAGGGGTDMRVGIDHAAGLRPSPHVIIVLTDGETPWPEIPPKAKLVIGLVANHGCATPEYARLVNIHL